MNFTTSLKLFFVLSPSIQLDSIFRIGLGIARRLLKEGASVVVSSRKQKNVDEAVKALQTEGLKSVSGIVCHVGKKDDRSKLFAEV